MAPHEIPQPPQLLASVLVLVEQEPEPQSAVPAAHATHEPAVQVLVHSFVHDPQVWEPLCRLDSHPSPPRLPMSLLQSPKPDLHAQFPLLHTVLAPHTLLHEPQLLTVVMAVSQPGLASQLLYPGEQLHVPPLQSWLTPQGELHLPQWSRLVLI